MEHVDTLLCQESRCCENLFVYQFHKLGKYLCVCTIFRECKWSNGKRCSFLEGLRAEGRASSFPPLSVGRFEMEPHLQYTTNLYRSLSTQRGARVFNRWLRSCFNKQPEIDEAWSQYSAVFNSSTCKAVMEQCDFLVILAVKYWLYSGLESL